MRWSTPKVARSASPCHRTGITTAPQHHDSAKALLLDDLGDGSALLANLGYEVVAVTGRLEHGDYLRGLGAKNIVERVEIAETVKCPLESEHWSGCFDAVGGAMLARVLGQLKYGASVTAVGLAGAADLPPSYPSSCAASG